MLPIVTRAITASKLLLAVVLLALAAILYVTRSVVSRRKTINTAVNAIVLGMHPFLSIELLSMTDSERY